MYECLSSVLWILSKCAVMPQEQHITLAFGDGGRGHAQISHRRDVIIISIVRAVFALGSFVLKAAASEKDQQEPLQLQTRVIGAAFFCILSIVPLRRSKPQSEKGHHDDSPSNTDSQSTAGHQLMVSRKSRMLALYLILWWYACRAIPSIQFRVTASPVANAAYNHFLEKLGNIICQNDGDERQRDVEAAVEQRMKEERIHIQSMQSQKEAAKRAAHKMISKALEDKRAARGERVADLARERKALSTKRLVEERSARLSAEAELRSVRKDVDIISSELNKERNVRCPCTDNEQKQATWQNEHDILNSQIEEMKHRMNTMHLEYQEMENALKLMEEETRTEIALVGEARDELERQAFATKQKREEELARARDKELQLQQMLKQTKAEQHVLEKTFQDAKRLIETLKGEIGVMQSEVEDNSHKLKATQEELAAEIQLRIQEEQRRKQAEEREALANNDTREKSQMLQDAIAEREACIAAQARKRLFKRGGKSQPERKTVNIQSALVEIWSTTDWLFALF